MPSRSGGERKDGDAILQPVTSRYWQTPGAAMAIGVGVGSTGFKRGFAIATTSLSPYTGRSQQDDVLLARYPSGTSKWNPVEHRLFSEISKNWAGRPLDSYETILKYIRTTTTSSGLRVRAHLIRRRYPKGVKITDERMQALSVTKDQTLPKWNYTIRPS